MNGLLPSTFTANMPSPSGYAPAMHMTCMNDPGPIPDGNGGTMIDPQYNPAYSTFCYTFQYMPGTTTYLDTPVLPVSAFASGYNPPDCSLDAGTPMIRQVNPLVAPGGTLTLTSMGEVHVPNPAYEGPLGSTPKTIPRDFGFGGEGILTLDGAELTGVTWTDPEISWTVPADFAEGEYQLVVTRDNLSSTQAITVTVSATETPIIVTAGGSIQDAIDSADYGDLILVEPGVYNESVIMWKPVRLQGSGAGSTLINGANRPTEKLAEWRAKMDTLFGVDNALPNQPVGAAGFDTEEGAAITVFGPNTNNPNQGAFSRHPSRIDGFAITGGDVGGGIFVNSYADNLEIANNNVFGNSGSYHGGIRIGRPFLELTDANLNNQDRFDFNTGLDIHHNAITQNGGLDGAGGGLSIASGTDRYNVSNNFVCGNFTTGDGGGIGHLGLSDLGVIANNRIVLNQTFNQGITVSGGGVFIGGEPGAGGVLTRGAGTVTVDGNLIQGNHAGAGHGGGIRTQFVNGVDVVNSLNNGGNMSLGQWHRVTMTNNMVVNNVAGWSGAGVSLQDTARSFIVNNTIAHNDTTATVQATFVNPNLSVNQPAGVSSETHSAGLNAAIYTGGNTDNFRDFSNPTLRNNIVWQNRSFHYDATGGTATLVPALSQADVGACDPGAIYSDLGVLGGGFALNPRFSVLTDGTGYAGNNTSGDPDLVGAYCNGGRTLTSPGPMQAIPALDEGGNAWIDVRFGPLMVGGDYHIGAASSAIDNGSVTGVTPDHDFDNDLRDLNGLVDRGADEVDFTAPTVSISPASLAFGDVAPGSSATLALTLSNTDTTAVDVTVGAFPAGFDRLNGTCGTSLASGSTCTIGVEFAPIDPGSYGGTVVISGFTVTLSGTGFSAPIATVTPASIAFGDVLTGSTATTDLTMSNTGNAALDGIAVGTLGDGFSRQGGTCDVSLAAGASCTITVEFAPTTAQFYGGTVEITATNATVINTSVTLSGTGLSAPIASISPTPLAFGDVATGTTTTLDLSLSNTGNATLTGINLGTFPAGFSRQGGSCGATLAAGVTCTITVQFAPTAVVEYLGDLSVTAGNATVANSPVTLTGSGITPQGIVAFTSASLGTLNAAGDELDFGILANGNYYSILTLTVTGDPVTFGAVTKTGGRFSNCR